MAESATPGTFIPHDTVAPARPRQKSGLNDLLLLCAIVLFVASGALAVAVFLYGQLLQTESTSKVAQLQRAEAAFEPSLIQQITQLDDRMRAGDTILHAHIAPTAFFGALNQATLQTVSFQSLDFEASDAQNISVKMQGVAQSVNSIALQADLFSKNGVITSPIFSNIARQADGVHFDLSASVNPAAISYASLVSGAQSAQSAAAGAASPSSGAPSSGTSGSSFGGTNAPASTGSANTAPASGTTQ
jgi:hypothetical protein